MDAISVLKRTILVVFATLLVAGSGMAQITVSSNSVMLNSSTSFQTVQVTASATTNFTFTITETDVPTVAWLQAYVGGSCMGTTCATGNSSMGSGSTNATLTIQLVNDLGSQGAGPFHAKVALTAGNIAPPPTINVTFTPGQGATGSTPVTPSSLTVNVPIAGSATNSLILQNNTGAAINITQVAPATSGNTWLSGSASPANVAAGGSSIITVTTTGTGSSAQLSDLLSISISNQPTVNIPVTLNVGAAGLLTSMVSIGLTSPNGIASQAITVSNVATSYDASASTTDGASWLTLGTGSQSGLLQVTNVSVNTPLNIALGSAAATLANGIYTGTVVVTDHSNPANKATIAVTLSVSGTPATSITVSPATSLSFFGQATGFTPPYQTLVLSAPAGSFTAQVTSNSPWLNLEGGSNGGTIPGNLQVLVSNLGPLNPGTYNGNIDITAGGLVQHIPVTLTIYASGSPVAFAGYQGLFGTSGTVLFTGQGSTITPSSQQVTVYASDGSSDMVTASLAQVPNWLTVTVNGNQLTIAPNASALSAALYSGFVYVNVSNGSNNTIANSQIAIPVVLTANGGTGGALTITPSQPLEFQSSSTSGVTPSSVTVSVSAATSILFSVSTPTPWVNIQSGTYYTNQSFTVTVTPGTLAPSSIPYTGEIDFTANGVTQKLSVSLMVTGGSNAGNVSADKSMLSFTAVAGGQKQSSTINVTSNGASVPFNVAISVQGAGTWLSSDTSSASTPKSVTITADPTTLTAGTYQGTVTITASNTVTIPVMFTVQAPPMVSAGATSLTFTYFSGGSAPPAQTVLISGSTGGFAASASSETGTWLSVTPASGAVGTNISVSVDPTGLSAGPYMGTVTVAGTNGLTGQVLINVSLTVTAPLPSVTSVGNGASYAQGTAAPGEVITLFGSNLGPATAVTAQIVNGYLTTQLGGVQVLVSGVAAPMIYATATQVSAVVPYEVARFSVAAVKVTYLGQTSNIVTLPVVATVPGIFTLNQSGTGAAVAYNDDFTLNGPNNPEAKGHTVALFLTGEGQTNPAGITGTINSTPNMNPMPIGGITVTIGGRPATYSYAGGIEGVVEGIMQLNVQVPANAPSGTVPIVVTIGGNSTQSGITVSLK
jgi:trimeric autotransporter adhesin